MRVLRFVDEGLGNSAHLVFSDPQRDKVAALVDPLRDVDRYLDAAAAEGVRITHVFETHIHNDFVTGSRELAARVGARIVAGDTAGLLFEHERVADGVVVAVGSLEIAALHTPGHTPEHMSYLVRDTATPAEPSTLFSGGSLLVGAVSRTDLLGHAHATSFAHELYQSLHTKILPLDDDVLVYPTHGAGSFCTAAPGAGRSTSIGQERRTNPLLRLPTPESFAHALLASMPSYPTYFQHMRSLNQRGPRVLGDLPELTPLTPQDVQTRQASQEAVVDLRPVAAYAAAHIPGVYHVELRPAFASWVGWVVPFSTPVILVADSDNSQVWEEAVRQLVRIGYDNLPGFLNGGMAAWKAAGLPIARVPLLTMRQVKERLAQQDPLIVVDVRQAHEWATGHIPQAALVEAGALPGTVLPFAENRPLAVHCSHGQRAATALSVLEHRGFRDLALIAEGVDEWRAAGGRVDGGEDSLREQVAV